MTAPDAEKYYQLGYSIFMTIENFKVQTQYKQSLCK